ncbi:MAG: substrate-binding domain-containing protein [Verrucomicrobiota bacterium]
MRDSGKGYRIALVVKLQVVYGRSIARAAMRYMALYPEVKIDLYSQQQLPSVSELESYDGLLLDEEYPQVIQLPEALPAIIMGGGSRRPLHRDKFETDYERVANIAASTLWRPDVASYSYYRGSDQINVASDLAADEYLQAFADALSRQEPAGKSIEVETPAKQTQITDWLVALAKPTAIFCESDAAGLEIIEFCRLKAFQIPREVMVMAIGNDPLLCENGRPPLSSIDLRLEELASDALTVLLKMIKLGKTGGHSDQLVSREFSPHAVLRESTGHSSVANSHIQQALAIIENTVGTDNLTAEEIATKTGISLRSLEQLFKQYLNVTLQQKLIETRIQYAKFRLRTSRNTIEEISIQLGWEQSHLFKAFKRSEGMTPGQYRSMFSNPQKKAVFVSNVKRSRDINLAFFSTFVGKSIQDTLRGVEQYIRLQSDVSVTLRVASTNPAAYKPIANLPDTGAYDGLLVATRVNVPERFIGKIPIVYVDHSRDHLKSYSSSVDNWSAGALAAKHFLCKGYSRFAYLDIGMMGGRVGNRSKDSRSSDRFQGFYDTLLAAGVSSSQIDSTELSDEKKLLCWLKALPRHTGLLTFNDALGHYVISCCHKAGVSVPDHVAVVGIDNDEFFTGFSDPKLSSVDIGFERGGFAIAQFLTELIRNPGKSKPLELSMPARYLATRESSSAIGFEDPALQSAVDYISQQYRGDIRIADIVSASGVSRRTLESRFKNKLHHSIQDEIRRMRLEFAARLLLVGDIAVDEITHKVGFKYTRHFCQLFREAYGKTPLEYRTKPL